ncbi:MAG: T9SS type A sorting domain-containing protein [Ignavibacteria bacterium]
MKSAIKLFVAIFFILAAVRTANSETYTVSGKVRYSDNNQIVTSGVVKLFNSEGGVEAITTINSQGDYILGVVRTLQNGDVIGIPDDEWEDFVPTGYPDQINPSLFTHIDINASMTGVDIYVVRKTSGFRPGATTTVNGIVLSNNVPVGDAIVYAMQGSEYVGFGVTNSKGEYSINNIPVGDYILVAHRVGSTSDSKQVTLIEKGTNNIEFTLTTRSANITNNTPYEFALSQNYPNPFNPSTVLSYSISKDGPVSLKVFNNAGQQVAELVNTNQSAGIYNVEFNASSLSSGIYFYTIKAADFTATKKMILVK